VQLMRSALCQDMTQRNNSEERRSYLHRGRNWNRAYGRAGLAWMFSVLFVKMSDCV